jgi:hypothetical protein
MFPAIKSEALQGTYNLIVLRYVDELTQAVGAGIPADQSVLAGDNREPGDGGLEQHATHVVEIPVS